MRLYVIIKKLTSISSAKLEDLSELSSKTISVLVLNTLVL